MSRPLRIEFSGALYHVTSRGDRREDIYLNDGDRERFLNILAHVCERFNWVMHTYCLMDNHYHLLLETPDANLSKGMRQLNGVYTQSFNHNHGRIGHVFQGRYKAILVERESYLLELARYIVLNPVRAGMVRMPQDWAWSSYRVTAGMEKSVAFLHTDSVLFAFSKEKREAMGQYRTFIFEGSSDSSPWQELKSQIYLGSEDFVDEMLTQVSKDGDGDVSEIPLAQRRPIPKPLLHYQDLYADRDVAITMAYKSGGYNMKEIGQHFNLHYSRISRIIKHKAKSKT